ERVYRASGHAGELYQARTSEAGNLGNVGRQRDRVALLERLDHLKEGGDAAFAVEASVGVTRAADDFHAQPLGRQCGHLAVAMMRDQRLALVGRAPDERREKVLA